MDQTKKNIAPFLIDLGVDLSLILTSLIVELAFGLRGLFFMALMAVFSRKPSLLLFSIVFLISSLASDVLFFHPLGISGMVYGLTFLAFKLVRQISRWRLLFYFGFGMLSVFSIEILSGNVVMLPKLSYVLPVVLLFGWVVSKALLYAPVFSQNRSIFLRK